MDLTNLVEGRHVYFWPRGSDHHVAAIVANVNRSLVTEEPTGRVSLTVFNRVGIPSSVVDVDMVPASDKPQGSGGWTWMFGGQEKVSTAGARPTMLEPKPLDLNRLSIDTQNSMISLGVAHMPALRSAIESVLDQLEPPKSERRDTPDPFQVRDDPWAHRSQSMRCRTCMFFVEKAVPGDRDVPENGPLGRCRRHAPTMSGFPAVFAQDWCGDHKLDERKA